MRKTYTFQSYSAIFIGYFHHFMQLASICLHFNTIIFTGFFYMLNANFVISNDSRLWFVFKSDFFRTNWFIISSDGWNGSITSTFRRRIYTRATSTIIICRHGFNSLCNLPRLFCYFHFIFATKLLTFLQNACGKNKNLLYSAYRLLLAYLIIFLIINFNS